MWLLARPSPSSNTHTHTSALDIPARQGAEQKECWRPAMFGCHLSASASRSCVPALPVACIVVKCIVLLPRPRGARALQGGCFAPRGGGCAGRRRRLGGASQPQRRECYPFPCGSAALSPPLRLKQQALLAEPAAAAAAVGGGAADQSANTEAHGERGSFPAHRLTSPLPR